MQDLTIKNFFSDLIFHPEHAKPEERNKSLLISIFLGVISLGVIPITVGIFWVGRSIVSWINSKMSPTDEKIQELVQKKLNEDKLKMKELSSKQPISTGFVKITNPALIAKITNLNLNLKSGELYKMAISEKSTPKAKTKEPISENAKTLAAIYDNTDTASIIHIISIHRNEGNFYLEKRPELTIEELLNLNWDKTSKVTK